MGMDRRISSFSIIYILISALLASAYMAAANTPTPIHSEPQKTVYIYGDRPLAKAFAKVFSAMGYRVIMVTEEKNKNTRFRVRADTQKPNVEITNPANGSYVSGNTTLTILAYDNVSVDTVILYIDGVQKKTWSGAGTYVYYWDTTVYIDGIHNVTVWANDTSGNTNQTYYEYTVDNTAPTVTITNPSQGAYVSTSQVTVTWSGSDNYEIDHYEISLDGETPINVGTNTSYTYSSVPDGDHNVTVFVYDKAGNANFSIVYFTVDTTNPTITITYPQSGDWLMDNNVTITWYANDTGSGIDHYEIHCYNSTWDSGWIDVGLNTSYTFTDLADGSYTVEVMAYDKAGNSGSDSVNFGVDTVAPTVTITSPADGEYVNTSDVTINWNGNDATSGIDHYEIIIMNSTWNSSWINVGLSTSHTFLNLADGKYTVYVKAIDLAGNVGADSIEFTVDTQAPTVVITAPANGSVVGGVVDIYVSSSDPHNDTTWLVIDGSVVQVWGGAGDFTYVWNTSSVGDGSHEVIAYANDSVGNVGSYRIILIVDNTPPTVAVSVVPVYDTVYVTGLVKVWANSSDPHNDTTWLVIDNTTVKVWSGAGNFFYWWDTVVAGEGNHTITAYANDTLGNLGSASITVIVDNSPPIVDITKPEDGAKVGQTFTVYWDAQDNYSYIAKVEVYLNGTLNATYVEGLNMTNNHTFSGLTVNAYYKVNVTVYDAVGKSSFDVITVQVVPVSVEIMSPANKAVINETQVNVTWRCTGTIDHFEMYRNGTLIDNNISSDVRWYIVTNMTSEAAWNITIKAVGIYGDVDSDFVIIYTDFTKPYVAITAPANNSVVSGVIDIYISSSDIHNDTTWLMIDGVIVKTWDGTYGAYTYPWNTSKVSDGSHEIIAYANDTGGNVGSYRIILIVDNTPPTVSIVVPENESIVRGIVQIIVNSSDVHGNKTWLEIDGNIVQIWNGTGNFTYDWNTTTYSEDQHVIVAYANDTVGHVASYRIVLTVDNTLPNVVIITPKNGSLLKGIVDINITVDDLHFDNVSLTINGTLVATWNTTGSHTYTWNTTNTTEWPDGRYIIRATAYDLARNVNSTQILVTIDNTVPAVHVLAPTNGSYVGGSSVTIHVTASDVSLVNLSLYINGSLVKTWNADGNTSLDVTYSWDTTGYPDNSSIFINATAYDKFGNINFDWVLVYTDNTPPEVQILSPVNGTWFNTTNVTITWSVSDALSGISKVELWVDGVNKSIVTGLTKYTLNLSEGQHEIEIRALDRAGNQGASRLRFIYVDLTPPEVHIMYVRPLEEFDGVYYTTLRFSIGFNWSESPALGQGITIRICLNDTLYYEHHYDQDSGAVSIFYINVSEGFYNLSVWGLDNASWKSVDWILIKAVKLAVHIETPANGTYINKTDVYVNWTYFPTGKNIENVTIYLDDKIATILYGNFTNYTIQNVAEGWHNITVFVMDTYGNTARDYIEVCVDTTPPTVTITSPSDGASIPENTVTVEWTVSDNYVIDRVEIRKDGGSWIDVTGSTSYTFSDLSIGTHTVDVRAIDMAGNIGMDSVTFRIITPQPPSIHLNITGYMYLPEYFNTSIINITVSVVAYAEFDVYLYVEGKEYYVGHYSENITETLNLTEIMEALNITITEGWYNITIFVVDEYGNNNTITRRICIDMSPPTITIQSPTSGQEITGDKVEVKGKIEDNLSGPYKAWIRIDNKGWEEVSLTDGVFVYTLKDLAAGEHTVYVKAIDRAGNTATESVKFKIVAPARPIPIELLLGVLLAVAIIAIVIFKKKKKVVTPEEAEAVEALREVTETI